MNLEEQISQFTNPQEFTRLCNAIFTAIYGNDYQVIDGSRSDGGNDGYIISEKRLLAMHCPIKPERKKDSDYTKKIQSDLNKAHTLHNSGKFEVLNWTFLTPRKLNNDVIVTMRQEAKKLNINANHQEATFFAIELNKHKEILNEFPQLQTNTIDNNLKEIISLLKDKNTESKLSESDFDSNKQIYKGKTEDEHELNNVLQIRKKFFSVDISAEEIKQELKIIYYKTNDNVVKINSLLGLLDLANPQDGSIDELVNLCDEGIKIADLSSSKSLKAYFLAQKSYLMSFIYSELDLRTTTQVEMSNAIGLQIISEDYRQKVVNKLNELYDNFTKSFDEAITITKENYDFKTLATILIMVGNAAGQRALYLNQLNIIDQAKWDFQLCKKSLLAAKDIYAYLKDEHGEALALFNLANHIRFFNEEKEALSLAENAVIIAKKYNDNRLLNNANFLIKKINT